MTRRTSAHQGRSSGPDRRRSRLIGVVVPFAVSIVVMAGLFVTPARAQEAPGQTPTTVSLGSVMSGEGGGVSATATSSFDDESATVMVRVKNTTGQPVSLEVPYGAMFGPDDEAQQTVVTAGLESSDAALVARTGATPTIQAPPGESSHPLLAFCGEKLDSSPRAAVPVSYRGVARDPLPKVLRNIAAHDAGGKVAQDAVWWVTDKPTVPVNDAAVNDLLEGVDTASFAAAPTKVVAGDSYTPEWNGGKKAGLIGPARVGSGGTGLVVQLLILLAACLAATVLVVWLVRRKPAVVPSGASIGLSPRSAGWYADPWSPGQRYWDGQGWTEARRGW